MSVVFHIVGIFCLFSLITGYIAGHQISAVGIKTRSTSAFVSIAYIIWLFVG